MTDRLSVLTSTPTVQFYLEADELSHDASANSHVVRCFLRAVNRGDQTTRYGFSNASVSASVNGNGFGVSGADAEYAAGVANGGTFWEYGPFDITVTGNPSGTATVSLVLVVDYPSALDTGGSASTSFALPTLTVVPGVPSGLSLVRNSDTQATLAWTNNGATNGQPTSNQVRKSVNGGTFSQIASIVPSTSLVVSIAANQKVVTQVRETNGAGSSAWSGSSNPVFTTPAAPTTVVAAKDASGNITISWTDHVPFSEHQHLVEHGTITGGVTTWDGGSPLATVASGTTSFLHSTPNPAQVHVYRVSAKNTDTGALQSAKVVSNSVQLLAAPNKPTLPTLPGFADKAAAFVFTWTHNPVDTTPQKFYESAYSLDGGSTWTSTGKVTSATSSKSYASGTFTANQAPLFRVRTWGSATSGGADGAGASPWSDTQAVTFKTKPTVSIASPADGTTWVQAHLVVALSFAQTESASFVQATIQLKQGSVVLETVTSTTLSSTALSTLVGDGESYSVVASVKDSNGLISDAVTSTFDVEYTDPVAATFTATYLPGAGVVQLDITFPDPGAGEAAAASVIITRTIMGTINDSVETVLDRFAITDPTMTVIDYTPITHGTNAYTVTTLSEDGATADALQDLDVMERRWAFLSTGPGFTSAVMFGSALNLGASPARAMSLKEMAGRKLPVAQFGENTSLTVPGTVTLFAGKGSSPAEVEQFVRAAGIVCYRDPNGRRIFGVVTGTVDSPSSRVSTFRYQVVESSR